MVSVMSENSMMLNSRVTSLRFGGGALQKAARQSRGNRRSKVCRRDKPAKQGPMEPYICRKFCCIARLCSFCVVMHCSNL